MKSFAFLGLAAAVLAGAAGPALSHQGMMHGGCPAGQTFIAGDVTVTGAFSRATLPAAKVAGGFLTIANSGQTADRLIAATSEVADAVELHQMKMEGDMMKMSPVDGGIDIPPGGTVELAPGGIHIMFIGIGQPFEEGACVEVTLTFEQAGEMPVVLSVGGVSAASAAGGHQPH